MTEPTPLTAAEIEDRPWGIATDIDGWLLFRDRALATIDTLRTQLEQAARDAARDIREHLEDCPLADPSLHDIDGRQVWPR